MFPRHNLEYVPKIQRMCHNLELTPNKMFHKIFIDDMLVISRRNDQSSSKELKQNCIISLEEFTPILEGHFLEMQDLSCLTMISKLVSFLKLNIIVNNCQIDTPNSIKRSHI